MSCQVLDQYDGSEYSVVYQLDVAGPMNRDKNAIREGRRIAEKHTGESNFCLEETSSTGIEDSFKKVG